LRDDGERLLAFVRAGGRLIVGGLSPDSALTALFQAPPDWAAGPGAEAIDTPTSAASTGLPGVATVLSAGAGTWTQSRGYDVLLTDPDGSPVLMARRVGAGEIVLVADPSPLQNAYLGDADNAQLALTLSAARPLVFVESVHGYGTSRGLAALPAGFQVALAGLALAALLWVLSRWRRLGPPDTLDPLPTPPRAAYVQAMSLLLRRSGPPSELTPSLRAAAERELSRTPATDPAARRLALARRGLDEAEIDALTNGDGDPDVLALAGAVARLRSRR